MKGSYHPISIKVLAFGLLAGLVTACGNDASKDHHPQLVSLTEATATGQRSHASYPGTTEARNNTDLSFMVAGTIAQVLVKEGDHVTAGQVVARLDDRDYRTQLRATEAEFQQIEAECSRVIAMHKEHAVSDNNYDKARYGLRQITEKFNHHRHQLEDCVLHAPFSGFVDIVYKSAKETTAPGVPVLSLYSSDGCDVVIHIPERDQALRKQTATYTATFPSLPGQTFSLTVKSMSSKADASHLYEMRLALSNPVPDITPGMTAMVNVECEQSESSGVAVPAGAVWAEGQQSYVFLFNAADSTLHKTAVGVERIGSDGTIILSQGLKAGSLVVAAGVRQLTDGQTVSVARSSSELNVGNLK
jgi:RND family efflux transporter MFP subunit